MVDLCVPRFSQIHRSRNHFRPVKGKKEKGQIRKNLLILSYQNFVGFSFSFFWEMDAGRRRDVKQVICIKIRRSYVFYGKIALLIMNPKKSPCMSCHQRSESPETHQRISNNMSCPILEGKPVMHFFHKKHLTICFSIFQVNTLGRGAWVWEWHSG